MIWSEWFAATVIRVGRDASTPNGFVPRTRSPFCMTEWDDLRGKPQHFTT